MTEGLSLWWRLRTVREQRLLLVMLGLLLIVLLWLLMIQPLASALDTAKSRHDGAVVALAEAQARAEAMRGAPADTRVSPPLPVDSFLSRTATEAGFVDARIVARGPAAATVSLGSARPQAAFAWLRLLESSGLRVVSLRASVNGDRTLALEADLRARAG